MFQMLVKACLVRLINEKTTGLQPGLHEPQLPVEKSITLVSSIVIERRRARSKSTALVDYKRIKKRDTPLNLQL